METNEKDYRKNSFILNIITQEYQNLSFVIITPFKTLITQQIKKNESRKLEG